MKSDRSLTRRQTLATQDAWITRDRVEKFQVAMSDSARPYASYWYEAQHAFANPSIARYDADDAKLAWFGTLAFPDEYLS